MLFSKYRAQNRETARSSDFWSILASSVQTHEARMCWTILKKPKGNVMITCLAQKREERPIQSLSRNGTGKMSMLRPLLATR